MNSTRCPGKGVTSSLMTPGFEVARSHVRRLAVGLLPLVLVGAGCDTNVAPANQEAAADLTQHRLSTIVDVPEFSPEEQAKLDALADHGGIG